MRYYVGVKLYVDKDDWGFILEEFILKGKPHYFVFMDSLVGWYTHESLEKLRKERNFKVIYPDVFDEELFEL